MNPPHKEGFFYFQMFLYICLMDPEKILIERITHEIDMDLLRELQKISKVDLTKEIDIAEKKFNNKLDRVLNNLSNDKVHERNNI